MHFYEKLETTFDKVVTKNILLPGDFNAKHQEWCSRDLTTYHGNALKELMDSYGLTQVWACGSTAIPADNFRWLARRKADEG